MKMKFMKYDEALKSSSDCIKKLNAPLRANKAKKRAELKLAEIVEEIAATESELTELAAKDDLDFNRIIGGMDHIDLLVRKKDQVEGLIDQLF
jgi:hypothetical protein